MRWTGLLDLQNSQGRLHCELSNQLKFSVGEGRHHVNLNP